MRTSRTPSDHVHSLGVLDEGGQIADLALLAVGFDFPELAAVSIAFRYDSLLTTYPNIVVAACGCQTSLAVGFEMGGVDGGVFIVPGHQKGSCLHRGRCSCVRAVRTVQG